jgi:hypothetical protein
MHRSSDLVPSDVTTIGGIPVTTRARTLLDLGAVVRPGLVSRALEQWLREGHTTVRQVRAALDDVSRKGRRGAGVLRQVLDGRALGTQPSDALAELVLAETMRAMGSPQPAYHHLIHVGAEVFEADFAYPELMLAIEVDGYGPHTTPAQFEEDRRRQNLIVEVGYMVQRYTAKRVLSRPRSVAEDVERIRRARAASPWFRGAQGATDGTPRASEPRWAS